jgi:uncharacterized membrane protein YfcA
MMIVGFIASVLIGISIGLVGAGGSILAMPILVYLFHIQPTLATSYSLFIVGVTALFGAIRQYKFGNLQLLSALYFAISSGLAIILVRRYLMPSIPDSIELLNLRMDKSLLLMIVFAGLMIAASLSMIKNNKKDSDLHNSNYFKLFLLGLGVGCVTGFLGAGGGFLIIPSLVVFAGIPIKKAIGTSLVIIFLNSTFGFMGDLIQGVNLNLKLLFLITGISIVGMLIGTILSKKISGQKLKPFFGWFILIMGIFIIAKELLIK